MGDSEKKTLNILGSIPLVGGVFKLASKGVLHIVGEKELAAGIHLDVADLFNPIRMFTEPVRQIVNSTKDYKKNIWIGKRSLGKFGVGLSFSTGTDLFHYAIMIDGFVYHVQGNKSNFKIEVSDNQDLINSFQWYSPGINYSKKTTEGLKKLCADLEKTLNYGLIPLAKNKANCQTFVLSIYEYAAGISESVAMLQLVGAVGNIFV